MSSPHLSPVTTDRSWDDLALPEDTIRQVEQIKAWLRQPSLINRESAEKKLKPGYRSLFYGPQGSGKKLTAALIGKEFDKLVYKSIFQTWCQNILVKQKRTWRPSLIVRKEKNGYYFD